MSILERLKLGMLPQPLRQKAIYDLQRVGVQGRPQYPDTNIASLQLAHRRNEIVYAAIKAKAQAAVDPRLIVQERTQDTSWQEVAGHPLRRLLLRPNPEMDEAAFFKAAIISMDIAGVFYAEIVRGANKLPVALYPLNPAKIAVIPGERNAIAAYEWKDGSARSRLPAEDMLVWRAYDPLSQWHGLSPLAVCIGSVDADSAQTDFIRAFFNNAGVPSGILKVKGRTVSNDEAEHMKAKWRSRFGRAWGTQHDIAVFDENAEYQKIGANLDELQSEVLREFTETRVAMVFGVPPLIIYAFAGLKRATYSNLKEAWSGFWDSTLTPLLKEWRTLLTWRLLPEFGSEDLIYGERIRLNWDLSQVAALQEDVDAVHARAEKGFRAGGVTLNEYRSQVQMPPDPLGDYYLRGLAQVAVAANEQPQTTLDPAKRHPRPQTVKALRDVSTAPLEKRIERVVRPYLFSQYEKVAAAL